MSYKKLSLPAFMGADSKSRGEDVGGGGGAGGQQDHRDSSTLVKKESVVVRAQTLKKLKNNKKKWFVLFGLTSSEPARYKTKIYAI